MVKNTKRILAVLLSLVLIIMNVASVYASGETDAQNDALLIDVQNIEIASGSVYDLSASTSAANVLSLTEGTIFVEFESSSTQTYQSLFSVSNPLSDEGCMYRHFHLYVTPSGTLGMELRNTDSEFKYTMAQSGVLNTSGTNKVAFTADAARKTYKLFANGSMVGELTKEDFKFFSDITGLTKISLGGTIRNQSVAYPFGGTISTARVYNESLSDVALISMTALETAPDESNDLLLEKSNIAITSGSYQDLTSEANAAQIMGLSEGTIVMSFTTTSTNGVQSLFSVGNGTSGNSKQLGQLCTSLFHRVQFTEDTVHLLPQFRAVFLVDMRRELSLLHSGKMRDPTEIIQNDLREITFPDVVRAAGSFSFLAVGIALEIVLQLFHGRGTMQHHWLSAICTEYQSGKDVRFIHVLCRALFVLPHLLHDLPLLLRDGRLVRVFYQTLFAFRPVDPRFVLIGDGRPPQSNRMAQIHDVFENITDRRTRPCAWMQRIAPLVRFSGLLKVVICRCQNIPFRQNPRDLARTFPSSTEGKNLPHNLCRFWVGLKMVFRSFGFSVPIGWTASEPFAAFSLQLFHGANLPTRVLRVEFVCPVADRVKIVAALDRRIHAVVHCDEPHIFLREIDLHVVADLQVLTPQPGGILYDQGGNLTGFDHFHDLFPTRTFKIRSGISVVRKKERVFKAFIPCVFF